MWCILMALRVIYFWCLGSNLWGPCSNPLYRVSLGDGNGWMVATLTKGADADSTVTMIVMFPILASRTLTGRLVNPTTRGEVCSYHECPSRV